MTDKHKIVGTAAINTAAGSSLELVVNRSIYGKPPPDFADHLTVAVCDRCNTGHVVNLELFCVTPELIEKLGTELIELAQDMKDGIVVAEGFATHYPESKT